MYYRKDHQIKSPEDWDNKVWRYLSTTQFMSILENDSLWFTRTDKFPDPYEGTLSQKALEKIEGFESRTGLPKSVEKKEGEHRDDIVFSGTYSDVEVFRRVFFNNCWNFKEYESKPMWDSKSRDGEGLAIMTSADNLKKSFRKVDGSQIFIGLVEYGDYSVGEIPEGAENLIEDWKKIHFHKPIEFEEERELRAIARSIPLKGEEEGSFMDPDDYSIGEEIELDWANQPPGINVPVDTSTLIQEVRLSPYADDWQAKIVSEVLETYDIDANVSKSNIFG